MTTEATETQTMTSQEIVKNAGEVVAKPETSSDKLSSEPLSAEADGSEPSGSSGSLGLRRGNILLLALLLVQAGIATYMLWPSSSVGEAGVPLLGEMESSAVTGLAIVDGDILRNSDP